MVTFFDKTPWQNQGSKINPNDVYDIGKGIKSAGLDWQVGLEPLCLTKDNRPVKHRAVVRQDNNNILGVVGPSWTPCQNWEMFSWFQNWLDSKICSLHTAGCLYDGKKIWVLCQINDNPLTEVIKGDDVAKFILLANSHDGSMAVRGGFTFIRVVCANTLSTAIHSASSQLIKIRHSSKVVENMTAIKDIMDMANREFTLTTEKYRYLATKKVQSGDLQKYVKTLLSIKDSDKISTRTKNIMDDMFKMITSGQGQDNPTINGTYWQAYNGVNEYLNYTKGRNTSNRLNSLWFGQDSTLNEKAFELALSM